MKRFVRSLISVTALVPLLYTAFPVAGETCLPDGSGGYSVPWLTSDSFGGVQQVQNDKAQLKFCRGYLQ